MRTATMGAAALTVGLVAAPLAAAPASATTPQVRAGWTVVTSYCSPSGDICYGILRKGETVRFRLTAFGGYFKTVDFCVKKAGSRAWVCRERPLKQGKNDIYVAKIRWQGNYPTNGDAKRVVRFMKGSPKLKFFP